MKFFMPVGFLAIRIPTAAALAFVLASLIALLMLAASPAQAAGWKPACNPLVPPPCTVQGDPIAAAITSLHHNYDPVVPTGNGGMATDVFGHPSLATMGGTRTSIPFNVGGAATTDCTGFRFMSMMGCTNGPSGPQKKPTCPDSAGDPINIATGDHYEEATDFTTRGADPLALTRSYNSDLNYVNSSASAYSGANTPYQSRFGYAWRSQYDRFIQEQLAADRLPLGDDKRPSPPSDLSRWADAS